MAPISIDDGVQTLRRRIGDTIRHLREEKSLSQEKFAELTGHHRTYIGFLERGERTPNVATLQRIAEALGIKLSELLNRAGL